MVKLFEKLDKVGVTLEVRVSARGNGLCLPLPKRFCEVNNVISGDVLKVDVSEHLRKKVEE